MIPMDWSWLWFGAGVGFGFIIGHVEEFATRQWGAMRRNRAGDRESAHEMAMARLRMDHEKWLAEKGLLQPVDASARRF